MLIGPSALRHSPNRSYTLLYRCKTVLYISILYYILFICILSSFYATTSAAPLDTSANETPTAPNFSTTTTEIIYQVSLGSLRSSNIRITYIGPGVYTYRELYIGYRPLGPCPIKDNNNTNNNNNNPDTVAMPTMSSSSLSLLSSSPLSSSPLSSSSSSCTTDVEQGNTIEKLLYIVPCYTNSTTTTCTLNTTWSLLLYSIQYSINVVYFKMGNTQTSNVSIIIPYTPLSNLYFIPYTIDNNTNNNDILSYIYTSYNDYINQQKLIDNNDNRYIDNNILSYIPNNTLNNIYYWDNTPLSFPFMTSSSSSSSIISNKIALTIDVIWTSNILFSIVLVKFYSKTTTDICDIGIPMSYPSSLYNNTNPPESGAIYTIILSKDVQILLQTSCSHNSIGNTLYNHNNIYATIQIDTGGWNEINAVYMSYNNINIQQLPLLYIYNTYISLKEYNQWIIPSITQAQIPTLSSTQTANSQTSDPYIKYPRLSIPWSYDTIITSIVIYNISNDIKEDNPLECQVYLPQNTYAKHDDFIIQSYTYNNILENDITTRSPDITSLLSQEHINNGFRATELKISFGQNTIQYRIKDILYDLDPNNQYKPYIRLNLRMRCGSPSPPPSDISHTWQSIDIFTALSTQSSLQLSKLPLLPPFTPLQPYIVPPIISLEYDGNIDPITHNITDILSPKNINLKVSYWTESPSSSPLRLVLTANVDVEPMNNLGIKIPNRPILHASILLGSIILLPQFQKSSDHTNDDNNHTNTSYSGWMVSNITLDIKKTIIRYYKARIMPKLYNIKIYGKLIGYDKYNNKLHNVYIHPFYTYNNIINNTIQTCMEPYIGQYCLETYTKQCNVYYTQPWESVHDMILRNSSQCLCYPGGIGQYCDPV